MIFRDVFLIMNIIVNIYTESEQVCEFIAAVLLGIISRDDIKNPDSDIYLEKVEYDKINRKHQYIS